MRGDQVAVARPVQPLQIADRGGTLAMTAERGKVVQSQQFSRRGGHRVDVQGARPGGDVAGLLRLAPRRAPSTTGTRNDAAAPRTGRRNPLGRGRCRATRTSAGRNRPRRRTSGRNSGSPGRGDRGVGVRQRIDRHVDVGHLPGGVHARVGAPGRPQPHRRAEDGRQRLVEHAGDRALAGLSRPAREIGSVVGDVEPKTDVLANSRWHSSGSSAAASGTPRASASFGSGPRRPRASAARSPLRPSGRRARLGLDRRLRLAAAAATGASDLLRSLHPTRPVGLRRHRLLPHQLDHGHRGVVALARLDLDDAGVAAVAVGEERPDLGEQGVHDVLVADLLEHLTTVVQRALLGVRDQLLRVRPQRPGLRLGRLDPAVLEQRRGQVGQNRLLVRRRPAEARALGGLGHC